MRSVLPRGTLRNTAAATAAVVAGSVIIAAVVPVHTWQEDSGLECFVTASRALRICR
jgi:hypothetical protein